MLRNHSGQTMENTGLKMIQEILNEFNSEGLCMEFRHLTCRIPKLIRAQMQRLIEQQMGQETRQSAVFVHINETSGDESLFSKRYVNEYLDEKYAAEVHNMRSQGPTLMNKDKSVIRCVNSADLFQDEFKLFHMRDEDQSEGPETSSLQDAAFTHQTNIQEQNISSIKMPPHTLSSSPNSAPLSWKRQIFEWIRQWLNVILVILIIGILLWIMLLYGAYLGMSICACGRSCFPLMLFQYTPTRRFLF
ncbi:uncharacterized protein LOC105697353 [Orussus abietinus]|uniref:uncharacterized protein LOC105697353 n=1 Tax=Orussus abietinus TaxID=222816 RepID=UPI000625F37A|nr:uncharacterized protein LOC105697353 [Orussus abietinus]